MTRDHYCFLHVNTKFFNLPKDELKGFLLCYHLFTDAIDLCNTLIQIFNETDSEQTEIRVANIFKCWVTTRFDDFQGNEF